MKKSDKRYFNYKGNSFIYTDDKWKTFLYCERKTPTSEYLLENNQDIITKTRIKFEFGPKASKIIFKELELINQKFYELTAEHLPDKTGFGHEFEILAISVIHDVTIDDVINRYVVKGTEDGQIDAVYYNSDEAIVYQIKLGSINDNAIYCMKNTITEYNKNRLSSRKECKHIREFLDNMNPSLNSIPSIKFRTISTNGKLEENTDYSYIFKKYIHDLVIKKGNSNILYLTKQVGAEPFDFCENKIDGRTFFMFSHAKTLVKDIKNCYGNNYSSLFCENVRGDLGENQHMMDTLTNNPKLFCSYNNGISITGEYKKPANNGLSLNVKIYKPNIINGQQTILNLIKAYERGLDLNDVTVPVFIKNIDDPSEELNIAKYNNTQKSISPIDLLSLDLNLRTIQSSLLESGFYLNLISSGKNIYISNAKIIFGSDRIIKLSDFAKVYSVCVNHGDLGRWKNNFNFQVESTYKDGFPICENAKAKRICEVILQSKHLIKRDRTNYAIADLAIQYLLYAGYDCDDVLKIIGYINSKYSLTVKKKADIYKKPSVSLCIKEAIKDLKISK